MAEKMHPNLSGYYIVNYHVNHSRINMVAKWILATMFTYSDGFAKYDTLWD